MADIDRGGTRINVLSLVPPIELLGNKSASDLVPLLDEDPSRANDLPFRIVHRTFASYCVPDSHQGHEPHFFVTSFLDLHGLEDFTRGAIERLSRELGLLLPCLAREVFPGRGILFTHVLKLSFVEDIFRVRPQTTQPRFIHLLTGCSDLFKFPLDDLDPFDHRPTLTWRVYRSTGA